MCYRFRLVKLEPFVEYCDDPGGIDVRNWSPHYNVALTTPMPVIITRGHATLTVMNFRFTLPARAPGEHPLLLGNARSETMLEKSVFRDAVKSRRCLVPADGFYEWEKLGARRQPHFFQLRGSRPFCFAGLWQPAHENSAAGFVIVTTAPNNQLRSIHDRMPVILDGEHARAWVGDQPLSAMQLGQLCQPCPADRMTSHPVDSRMSNARYQASDCADPVQLNQPPEQPLLFT